MKSAKTRTHTCTSCKKNKTSSEFYASSATKNGLSAMCKECHQKRYRKKSNAQVCVVCQKRFEGTGKEYFCSELCKKNFTLKRAAMPCPFADGLIKPDAPLGCDYVRQVDYVLGF